MNKPQLENGYVKIANEIVEALAKIRISGEEMQILWVIIRKTYGWNKKEDKISLNQFSELTGIKRPNIVRAIKKLIVKGVIKKDNSFVISYSFNKDYDKWVAVIKKDTGINNDNRGVSKKIIAGINNDNKGGINNDTHNRKKDTTTKDTITKDTSFETFWKLYPRKIGKDKSCKKFNRLINTNKKQEDVLIAINNYCLYVKNKDKKYIKHCTTWLSDWQDWIELNEDQKEETLITHGKMSQTQIDNFKKLEKWRKDNAKKYV